VFVPQDNVTFNDSFSSYNVTLNSTVQPGSMTFNNSTGNYTISGTGSIIGTGGLTKQGTGSVTLANSGGNSFTGPTAIQNGTLIVGDAKALSAASAPTLGNNTT